MSNKVKLLLTLLITLFLNHAYTQCVNAPYGQWPTFTYPSDCEEDFNGVSDAWGGEYTLIAVEENNTYEFLSYREVCNFQCFFLGWPPVIIDYNITITNFDGTIIYATDLGSVTWEATSFQIIRFYSHVNLGCGANTNNSIKLFRCIGSPLGLNEYNFNVEHINNVNKLTWDVYGIIRLYHTYGDNEYELDKNRTLIYEGYDKQFLHKDYVDGLNYYLIYDVTVDLNDYLLMTKIVNVRDKKRIVKIINLLGQEVPITYKGIKILIYNDGSIVKTI